MGTKLGMDAKLYLNSGTYESPTWDEIDHAKDVTLNLDKGEDDVTTRASGGWEEAVGTLKSASIDFDVLWDMADANVEKLWEAFLNNTAIEFAVMDGDIATVGSRGIRATMNVFKFTRNENLKEAITASVTIKPTAAEHPPAEMEITS